MGKTEEQQRPAKPQGGRANLVQNLAASLREEILSDAFQLGTKLPSEAALTEEYKVSRTVVREAIASLRSDGLVETRQGAGAFVISQSMPSNNMLKSFIPNKISSIIEVLELRMAVEIEAAALAARRRSPAQEGAILEACNDMKELAQKGALTVKADFEFHKAIADATNNKRFPEFLEMMGNQIIPRQQLVSSNKEVATSRYLQQIVAEHDKIALSISSQDEQGARDAMRLHLEGGSNRYRELLR
ncbi:FadR/GntR family transcriptional regulator [Cohaesibacter gelatinilyticus]|uniref:Transcriptional regulator, GntR family n=1 Tax=Cohaesibacter gelatinilyticus TaxID=372072 RepID=A0A285NDS4_9HYPH|nr:FadR/GntR family transcriptional regulator [Cohaesibacter gelatinilyticus]SNZ07043.1 transcriptional regulator, GntR family [Cohaesibacter gelatinilyticus]HAT87490.1 FadR family transcriptional regulator [Hyphomicrobiales bacterium]